MPVVPAAAAPVILGYTGAQGIPQRNIGREK